MTGPARGGRQTERSSGATMACVAWCRGHEEHPVSPQDAPDLRTTSATTLKSGARTVQTTAEDYVRGRGPRLSVATGGEGL